MKLSLALVLIFTANYLSASTDLYARGEAQVYEQEQDNQLQLASAIKGEEYLYPKPPIYVYRCSDDNISYRSKSTCVINCAGACLPSEFR